MSDILCALCGEPWDAYGVRHGDMEPWEAKKFLAGQGCPSCGFGICTICNGTGKRILSGKSCPACKGTGKIERTLDSAIDAAISECDWSDEDPILILQRRDFDVQTIK